MTDERKILLIVVAPVILFAALMILFPKHKWEILGVEIASPIPPIP